MLSDTIAWQLPSLIRSLIKTTWIVAALLLFVIMTLHTTSSFMPPTTSSSSSSSSSSSLRSDRPVHQSDHIPFLISSQVNNLKATASEEPSSSASASELQLIPSQVLKTSSHVNRQEERLSMTSRWNVTESRINATYVSSFSSIDVSSVDSFKQKRKWKRSRRKHMKKDELSKDGKIRRRRILTGNLPDIHWRAVPMEHLRLHPLFIELPPPESIESLDTMEDVCMFSQDSWQWDALHEGRCTTSTAAAALGLLEPEAGHALNIPISWRKGGKSAYYRMRQRALRTLDEMNDALCAPDAWRRALNRQWHSHHQNGKGPLWAILTARRDGTSFPFAAKYLMKITPEERAHRRLQAEQYSEKNGLLTSVRMAWGKAQEATSILTALNYFWKTDPGVRIKETGMCGAGLSSNQTDSVLVGASPDGILCHSDGTIEALEVKNHCPFVTARYVGEDESSSPRYAVRQMPFRNSIVPPLYVPQLMMEMLCIGPECRSAVMVRQTATNGAVIMRMYRDDEWIDEMVYWLNRFQQDFVDREILPPTDFFWNEENDSDRYKRFVEWTKDLSSKVKVLETVKHHEIQRVVATSRNITSLFLD